MGYTLDTVTHYPLKLIKVIVYTYQNLIYNSNWRYNSSYKYLETLQFNKFTTYDGIKQMIEMSDTSC